MATPELYNRDWGQSNTVYVAKVGKGRLVGTDELAGVNLKQLEGETDGKGDHSHPKLGQIVSTSIAGNDLLSSCLYTGGICAGYAGKMAPLSLLLVAFMLYFFRFVYSEVVTALALNGGSYTALANTTSKKLAALAACLSIIAYVATAVVSSESAINYLQLLIPSMNNQAGTLIGTVSVLAVFAVLNIVGLSESAGVAMVMFILHVFTLVILIVWSLVFAFRDNWAIFRENLHSEYPNDGNWASALFFGYSAALLGITGFETAANYVEEMKDSRTYINVLRNMWYSVSIFNPILGLMAMAVLPMSELTKPEYSSNVLGPVAKVIGGPGFQAFVCVDGFIVLCGSVLTAYVGIGGLLKRLALDKCLPDVLLATNKARGTHHWIILGFFAVASSLFLALDGDVDMLSSVYNIAFLSVMTCFGLSCVVLKWKRPQMPRLLVSSKLTVFIAIACVVTGLAGNIARNTSVIAWFFLYFGVVVVVVFTMFNRTMILTALLRILRTLLAGKRARSRARKEDDLLVESHRRKEQRQQARSVVAYDILDVDRQIDEAIEAISASSNVQEGEAVHVAVEASDRKKTRASRRLLKRANDDSSDSESESSRKFKLNLSSRGHDSDDEHSVELTPSRNVTSNEHPLAGGTGSTVDLVHSLNSSNHDMSASLLNSEYSSSLSLGHSSSDELQDGQRRLKYGLSNIRNALLRKINTTLKNVNSQPYVFFCKGPDFETLNKAILYVRSNEQTARLIVVHVVDDREAIQKLAHPTERTSYVSPTTNNSAANPNINSIVVNNSNGVVKLPNPLKSPNEFEEALVQHLPPVSPSVILLKEEVALLDSIYPKLRLDFTVIRGTTFGPPVIQWLSTYLGIGTNMMFIAAPDAAFAHQFAALGGVRVITKAASKHSRSKRERHVFDIFRRINEDLRGVENIDFKYD